MRIVWGWLLVMCVFPGCTCASSSGAGDSDARDDASVNTEIDGSIDIDAGDDDTIDAGDQPDAAPCPPYQDRCDGVCIPTSTDPDHCGGCDVICDADQVCSGGACTDGCLPGLTECDRRCVDLETDDQYCGGCDTPCAPDTGCVHRTCVPSIGDDDLPMCAGGGPPIDINPGTTADCTAQSTFRWAICSCTDVGLSATLVTDAYDSAAGPYTPGGPGGGVGLNDQYSASGVSDISGTLWASSAAGMNPSSTLTVGQEVHSGGPFSPKTTSIGRDAFVDGNVSTSGTIVITGTLHQQTGATVSGNVSYGARLEEDVVVPEPCECAPDQLIPIATIVAAHATANDNSMIGLGAADLINPAAAVRLDLPCGNYYLTGIGGSKAIAIVAHGHTALYIDGNVQLSKELAITVDPDGTLDVLVAGQFGTSGPLTIGSPNYPALSRFYIGGSNGFQVSSTASLGAFFYAPNGLVGSSSSFEVYGGVFAGDFHTSGETKVHYDSAILDVGGDCTPPGECQTCQDCGNQACDNGTCGECTDSAQCCHPLVCVSGECRAID